MMRLLSNGVSFLLLFITPLYTVALKEVFVEEHDEEDRLVLIVDGPIEDYEEDPRLLRQRRLRGEISLESSVASGRAGKIQWWNQAYTYIDSESSWNKPSTAARSYQENTASATTTSNYFQSGSNFLFPQSRQQTPPTFQRSYAPPRPQDQTYTTQSWNKYAPPQQQQQPPLVSGQARSDPPPAKSSGGGVTLSRVFSNTDTLNNVSSRYGKPANMQYINPQYATCWPSGDQPLDLYAPETCCFLCRSGHNPTKPTRGVVVGANEHGLQFTGTCTGLHEHMRGLRMTMSDTMCKITQTTFADYCCSGELEVSTNWGTWTVK